MEMNCVEKAFKAKSEARFPERRITIGRTAHLTEPTEEQLSLGRTKCQYRNMCIRGCPFGGYYSSNSGGLVAAERTGNLVIRPGSIVTSLIYDEKAGKATGVRILDATTRQEEEFYADVVFLCASALNSAWIMMNSTSSRFPNGFGNGSDQLGRNVMDHHLGVGASGEAPEFADMYYSGRRPNGIYVPRFRNLGDAATKRNDYLRGFGYQGGASRPGWDRDLVKSGRGHGSPRLWGGAQGGAEPARPLDHRPGRVRRDPALRRQPDHPEHATRPTVRPADPVDERHDPRERAGHAPRHADRGGRDAGGGGLQERRGPRRGLLAGLGIHEMGTARMGRDPKTSVLNAHNQVHECKNVYVTDGAAMTSASCVNPSLTYMALTARAADHAVQARKRGEL
jgi:choline dehydrogenase-like flavoprotein